MRVGVSLALARELLLLLYFGPEFRVSGYCLLGVYRLYVCDLFFCRHFHYIPEVAAAFMWCAPALFTHALPYYYPFYLSILLTDRAWRDDARCADKYKEYWTAYCKKVPSKIIPGVI